LITSKRRVVVLGGGLAGITAALDCADAGAHVTLLEVRPRLGGAAYSFERDGLWLDNGQHVFLRCCRAYRALLERLGSTGRVAIQPRLEIPVLSPEGGRALLRRSGLPAPLHLAGALARYPHLSIPERLRAARAALALARMDPGKVSERERIAGEARGRPSAPGMPSDPRASSACGSRAAPGTLGEWLTEHGQDQATVAALWDLIALPTLNLPAAQGSLALGAFVLRTGLLEHNDAGDIGFHLRPLRETLGQPAELELREAGVEVRLGVRAEGVERVGRSGNGLRLREGELEQPAEGLRVRASDGQLDADAVICAVPHTRAAALLEPLLGVDTEPWTRLGESPIINVHVVYDRHVCELPFAAGVGTPVQYLFDRTSAAGLSHGQYLAVSLSGAEREMGDSVEHLRERYVSALGELFPRARRAVVRGFHVSREHAATFRAAPGVQALRPTTRTSVRGLVLAGAWTDTGWPATLEGAVLSGHTAAREALL
jgi:phytoene dehydrogenase-like protein